MLLEDQHRPQPDRPLSTASDIDAHTLRPLQEIVPPRAIPGQERALAPPTQVLNLVRVSFRQSLQSGMQVLARLSGVLDEVESVDLVDDGSEEDRLCRVAHPRVELSVWLVWAKVWVAKVVTGRLRFL